MVSYVVHPGLHQLIHQPTRTTMNSCKNTQRQKYGFAGISEHWRTVMTLWICLHTADVAGSIRHRPYFEYADLQVKPSNTRCQCAPEYAWYRDSRAGVPARPNSLPLEPQTAGCVSISGLLC